MSTPISKAKLQEFKDNLAANGITVSAWSRQHGFPPEQVRRVLHGYSLGKHGEAYRITVAMGLRPAPTGLYAATAMPQAKAAKRAAA